MLATEMFKVYQNIARLISSNIFHLRATNFNLRINSEVMMPNVRSFFSMEVKVFLKELTRVAAFKKGIKEWRPKNGPYKLCKIYVSNLGLMAVTS